MANENEHPAKVGSSGNGGGNSTNNVRAERRLFREYALSHDAIRSLFENLAGDHISLTSDQRGERLLSISNALAELREQTETTRIGIRDLAVEYMKGPHT